MKKLYTIQQELKAPKGERNNYGKYNYRTAEGILKAVKPLLEKAGLVITLEDKLIEMGSTQERFTDPDTATEVERSSTRNFIEATATIYDKEDGKIIKSVSAYAELDNWKKGMDRSQICGSASSYARKYAMSGLFAIDNTDDADSPKYQKTGAPPAPDVATIRAQIETAGLNDHQADILAEYRVSKFEDLTEAQRAELGQKLALQIKIKQKKGK